MDEAQTLADRVAVSAAGETSRSAPPDELGGRDARPAEVRFELPEGWKLDDLPPLTALELREDRGRVLVRTAEAVRTTAQITTWALEHDLELEQFAVSRPTLEDVYLELTGERSESPSATPELERRA